MQDIEDDVSILPNNENSDPPENTPENVTYVDIGSIQTDPKISESSRTPCTPLLRQKHHI